MKILFLSTSFNKGGAAIALKRLISVLKKNNNVEYMILTRDDTILNENCYKTVQNPILWFIEQAINKIFNFLGYQYKFLPFSKRGIFKTIESFNPDLINLHNNLGGYFQTDLIKYLSEKIPIVWTLHDMWALTSHCAYSYDCNKWQEICIKCPNLSEYPAITIDMSKHLWFYKENTYKNSNLNLITPSKWLENLVKISPLLSSKNVFQINNGVDVTLFKPLDKLIIRKKKGIDKLDKVLLFSAASISDDRKGGNYILNILDIIDKNINEKITILIIGQGNLEVLNRFTKLNILQLGYIKNQLEMAEFYSASDLFLFPTTADNLPNSLVESISCGLPAITFNIGGCSEIIKDDVSGYAINAFDVNKFALKVLELLNDSKKLSNLSLSAREFAINNFNDKSMAANYLSLFSSIIKDK